MSFAGAGDLGVSRVAAVGKTHRVDFIENGGGASAVEMPLIEASDKGRLDKLAELSDKLSGQVREARSELRLMGASGLGANEIPQDEMERLVQFAELMLERAAVLEAEIKAARQRAGLPPKKAGLIVEGAVYQVEKSAGAVDGIRLIRGVKKM